MRECPFVEVSKKQFAWNETDYGIAFRNGVFSLNLSDFIYGENESSAWVCLNTLYKLEQVGGGSINRCVNYPDVYTYILLLVVTYPWLI